MTEQTATLDWRDGTIPVSTRFDDPYFSLQGGLAETRHVFLDGNDLPARFGGDFRIAELGFGTGLNLLATMILWEASGRRGTVHFTSFEAYPMAEPDRARALAAFPEVAEPAAQLTAALAKGAGPVEITPGFTLQVMIGDAREHLPRWQGMADAWFLDGFSPAKNPELWGPDLMAAVGMHTASGGTAATYTAAGHVRRALADAGFAVERLAGYGRKRHMTIARKPA